MKRTPKAVAVALTLIVTASPVLAQQSGQGPTMPTQPRQTPRSGRMDPEEQLREAERWAEATAPARESVGKATQALRRGNLEQAESDAKHALELLPRGYPEVVKGANQIIATVRIRQGRYQEALDLLSVYWQGGGNSDKKTDLLIALCYVRLRQPDEARRFYDGREVLRIIFDDDLKEMQRALPGMINARDVEANILFALGVDLLFRGGGLDMRHNEMLHWYLGSAAKLAPRNGVIAYYMAETLRHSRRFPEAVPYYRRAAEFGRGRFKTDAIERLPAEEKAKYKKP